MGSDNNSRNKRQTSQNNVLEMLRDIGSATGKSFKKDLLQSMPKDFSQQLFGFQPRTYEGEIAPGEVLEFKEVLTGQREKSEKLQKQLLYERRLQEEEELLIERRTNELRLQIKALHEEVVKLAQQTPDLAQEVEIAAIQAPSSPSSYELFFFERLFNFIRSFREKIEKANVWLQATNIRAAKRNAWGARYKKYGAKYLLSGEHYLTRSAG